MKLIQTCVIGALLFAAGSLMAQKNQKPVELRIVLPNVQFAKEKSAIKGPAADELDEVAALLKKSPAVTLEIGAHTDASGSATYNMKLSQQRASAVSAYLVKKGISAKRLKAKGFGETKPINRCRRGVRCSEAEKRQNRRVEIHVQGLSAEVDVQNQWLALNGEFIAKPPAQTVARQPDIPKPAFTRLVADTNQPPAADTEQAAAEPGGIAGDYFPELNDGKQHVPQPLPNTFIGYAIEIVCAEKPLAAGHSTLRKYDPVFLRQEAGGRYCYFIGAFHTLPEAQQFLRKEALPRFPKAQVVSLSNDGKKYFTQ